MDDEKRTSFADLLRAASVSLAMEREKKESEAKMNFMPVARNLKCQYDCFTEVGFNSEQAMNLTLLFAQTCLDYVGGKKNG